MSNERPRTRRGLLLVISSPSGAGKTSLSRRLVADHPDLSLSVSATTRGARPGEEVGREYHFVSPEAFERMVAADAFLEWADVHEHRYGSPKATVMAEVAAGRDVLFDIDWQGARSIAAAAPDHVVRVFILPPSMAELSRRLHARAQDAEVVYDYVILNEDYDAAYAELAHIYHAERQRRARNPWLTPFVRGLLDEKL
jgi:guanylate kinase